MEGERSLKQWARPGTPLTRHSHWVSGNGDALGEDHAAARLVEEARGADEAVQVDVPHALVGLKSNE